MVGYTVKTTNVCFMTGQSAYYDDDVENADAYGMIDGRSKRCLTWLGWTDDAQSIQRAWCSSAAFRGLAKPRGDYATYCRYAPRELTGAAVHGGRSCPFYVRAVSRCRLPRRTASTERQPCSPSITRMRCGNGDAKLGSHR